MYGSVYVIYNNVNDKLYVGITINSVSHRMTQHIMASRKKILSMPISKAIKKYGDDKFHTIKLIDADTRDELSKLEVYYIDALKTKVPLGYNLRDGGHRGKSSEETKDKISKTISKKKFIVDGEEYTVRELHNKFCKNTSITLDILKTRLLKSKMEPSLAILPIKMYKGKPCRTFSYQGGEYTLKELHSKFCDSNNPTFQLLYNRLLAKKLPVEVAISPVRPYKGYTWGKRVTRST